MVLTGSTSVRPMLSQRLMPSTAASMVLVLMDTADSMATVDTLPTHTPMDMDTHLMDTAHTLMLPHTPMDTAAQLSLMDTT